MEKENPHRTKRFICTPRHTLGNRLQTDVHKIKNTLWYVAILGPVQRSFSERGGGRTFSTEPRQRWLGATTWSVMISHATDTKA